MSRLVSQMWVPLAACRKPAGKLWQLCKVLWSSTNFNASAFHFTSIISTIPQMWPMECLAMKKNRIEILKNKFVEINSNRINQFITMNRGRYLPSFVVILYQVILTLSWEGGGGYDLLSTKSLPLTRGFVYSFTHPASLWLWGGGLKFYHFGGSMTLSQGH